MAEINRNSDTWNAVIEWATQQRQDAVEKLIAGSSRDDRLRGQIEAMDELLALGQATSPGIPQPTYE
ncbi:hypothetical protein TW86_18080 [Halomonas sp. S2151]|uniref:hypothetical protein n=1 Tax=unclassified Halomonas TaxID=2609666 RepID=UPI0005F9E3FB|nr:MULTISPECIES: hypothetical protein [unclassified Halomonas]KJZ07165.1 hypothetical protein TW86_18080 [Halomonas sp. S2151]MBR9770040.1 hypothetical protein [Gammaproteobacteria bacterium]MBY6109079.1 hypothetical protein [Halomonas sp. DP1Y21-3]